MSLSCICESGFVPDPNGPGCVAQGSAGAQAQAASLCILTGGSGDDSNCSCPAGYSWNGSNGCVDSKGKAGGYIGGKTSTPPTSGGPGTKPTTKPGDPSTVPPVTPPSGLSALMGKITTPMLIAGGAAALLLVGGAGFIATKAHKAHKEAKGEPKDKAKKLEAHKAAKHAEKHAKKGHKAAHKSGSHKSGSHASSGHKTVVSVTEK